MKTSTQRLIVFQAGIISLCNKETEQNDISNNSVKNNISTEINADVNNRLNKIENYLRNLDIQKISSTQTRRATPNAQKKTNINT